MSYDPTLTVDQISRYINSLPIQIRLLLLDAIEKGDSSSGYMNINVKKIKDEIDALKKTIASKDIDIEKLKREIHERIHMATSTSKPAVTPGVDISKCRDTLLKILKPSSDSVKYGVAQIDKWLGETGLPEHKKDRLLAEKFLQYAEYEFSMGIANNISDFVCGHL